MSDIEQTGLGAVDQSSGALFTPSDRRKDTRKMVRTRVRMTFSGGHVLEVRSIDISETGLGVASEYHIHSGVLAQVQMQLILPKGLVTLDAQARVMYSVLARDAGGFKVGLQFTSLSTDASTVLHDFLRA